MANRAFKSLAEVSGTLRTTVPPGDLSAHLQAAFRLRPGSLKVSHRGDTLFLSTPDRAVRFALAGTEKEMLDWLTARGFAGIGRVSWSAD